MKEYILNQFNHFEKSDLYSGFLKEAILYFSAWAIPAFLFVLLTNIYCPNYKEYQLAIQEGIGPNLWNTIGSLGFFSFGVAIIFSKYEIPSKIATQILLNTYAIGSLTFGLLVGQWFFFLGHSNLVWWKIGLFGITSGFLLVVVFFYNLSVYYLSFLIRFRGSKSKFLSKLEQMHCLWRLLIGCSMIVLILMVSKYG